MRVKVTQRHIERATKNDCQSCPIAIAIRDLGMLEVYVADGGEDEISFLDPKSGKYVDCVISEATREFIDAFDNGEKVKPFSFDLLCSSKP